MICEYVTLFAFFLSACDVCTCFIQECNRFKPTDVVEAALKTPSGDFYVFSGSLVSKLKRALPNGLPEIEEGFPAPIAQIWPGVPPGLSAAFVYNDYIYFINGNATTIRGLESNSSRMSNNSTDRMLGKDLRDFVLRESDAIEGITSFSGGNGSSSSLVTVHRTEQRISVVTIWGPDPIQSPYNQTLKVRTSALEILRKTKDEGYFEGFHFSGNFFNWFTLAKDNFVTDSCYFPNGVWFGCPQILCFSAKIDAITEHLQILYIFGGNFVYEVEKLTKIIRGTYQIKDTFTRISSNLVDAAFVVRNKMYLFSETTFFVYYYNHTTDHWTHDDNELNPRITATEFKGVPDLVDSALYNDFEELAVFFKDYMYFKFDMKRSHLIASGNLTDDLPFAPDGSYFSTESGHSQFVKENYVYRVEGDFSAEAISQSVTSDLMQETFLDCPSLGADYVANRGKLVDCNPYSIRDVLGPKDEARSEEKGDKRETVLGITVRSEAKGKESTDTEKAEPMESASTPRDTREEETETATASNSRGFMGNVLNFGTDFFAKKVFHPFIKPLIDSLDQQMVLIDRRTGWPIQTARTIPETPSTFIGDTVETKTVPTVLSPPSTTMSTTAAPAFDYMRLMFGPSLSGFYKTNSAPSESSAQSEGNKTLLSTLTQWMGTTNAILKQSFLKPVKPSLSPRSMSIIIDITESPTAEKVPKGEKEQMKANHAVRVGKEGKPFHLHHQKEDEKDEGEGDDDENDSDNKWTFVWITLSAFSLIAIVILLFWCKRIRANSRAKNNIPQLEHQPAFHLNRFNHESTDSRAV